MGLSQEQRLRRGYEHVGGPGGLKGHLRRGLRHPGGLRAATERVLGPCLGFGRAGIEGVLGRG